MSQLEPSRLRSRPRFALDKWYLDGASEGGDVLIGYSAVLAIRGLTVRYTSALLHDGGAARTAVSLRRAASPAAGNGTLRWRHHALGVDGVWEAAAPPVDRLLFGLDGAGVRWRCVQPLARVRVQVGERRLEGLGYAERVELTVPPWRLPLDELRWGHFMAPGESLVWIGWRGDEPRAWVFHEGVEASEPQVNDGRVAFTGGELHLQRHRVLREGALGPAVLSRVPALDRLVPSRVARAEEHKWLSRGVLRRPGHGEVQGWVIHEVVHFPRVRRP